MAFFSRHRSYTEKVLAKRQRRKVFGRVLLFLLIIAVIRTFFVQSYTIRAKNMEPLIASGDSILVFPLPFGARTWFGKTPALSDIKRGELLVVDPDPISGPGRFFLIWDSVARFFSLQRYSPLARRYGAASNSPGVYRVVGLPGDRIRRSEAIYEIKTGSGGAFQPEQSLAEAPYELRSAESPEKAQEIEGFSEMIELGPGKYFVEGDNRDFPSGSSLWGPVGIDRISGRVVLIFWPFKHFRIL
jgi:signal peptidase I